MNGKDVVVSVTPGFRGAPPRDGVDDWMEVVVDHVNGVLLDNTTTFAVNGSRVLDGGNGWRETDSTTALWILNEMRAFMIRERIGG